MRNFFMEAPILQRPTLRREGVRASKEWPLRESVFQPVSPLVGLSSEGAQGIFAPSQSIVLGGRSEYRHV